MTPERWRQVEEIFQAALDLSPDERTKYVLEKCGEDETLRRDVQLLLSQHDSAGELLDAPLYANTELIAQSNESAVEVIAAIIAHAARARTKSLVKNCSMGMSGL